MLNVQIFTACEILRAAFYLLAPTCKKLVVKMRPTRATRGAKVASVEATKPSFCHSRPTPLRSRGWWCGKWMWHRNGQTNRTGEKLQAGTERVKNSKQKFTCKLLQAEVMRWKK